MTEQNNQQQQINMTLQKGGNALMNADVARQVQEVQASMMIAKSFPRDEVNCFNKIMVSCQRKKLAEEAMYAYPRGGNMITGPSIRLAEVIAQNWGNMQFGIREVSQENGFSELEAFAWDIENNIRVVKAFRVPHIRYSKKAGNQVLTDPRDIYEMTANQGARRLRACILGVVPGDVVESAIKKCEETLTSSHDKPLRDRIREMVAVFSSKFQVTQQMIETRLGHKIDSTTEKEMVELRKIYKSLDDNMASRDDFFEIASGDIRQDQTAQDINDRLKKGKEQPAETEVSQEPKTKPEDENQGIETEMNVSPKEQAEMTNEPEPPDYISLDNQAVLEGMCKKYGKDLSEVLINFNYKNLKEVQQRDLSKIVEFIKAKDNE